MMFQWFKKVLCVHFWRSYVRATGKIGEPQTWRQCDKCGHLIVEHIFLTEDVT